ncbi:MAG: hypothetical protein WA672_18000 [Candidatus Angelobacter sp.]
MLSAFIEDAELATLTPQTIPQDFSYSPELNADDEAEAPEYHGVPYVHVPRTGTPTLPVYSAEQCAADAALAMLDEPDLDKVTASLATVATPNEIFDIVMYSLEPRWPGNFRESEFKCSRWLVAARACEGTALWPRYVAAEKAAERGTVCVDVELRQTLGKAWKAAGLHNIGKHLRAPRHRHHSAKKKIREQRKRERPQAEDNRIRLWLDPQLSAQRAAEQGSGIMRGTLR